MLELLEPITTPLALRLGYSIGFFVVTICSIGLLAPEPFEKIADKPFWRSIGMKRWQLTYLDGGTRYLPAEAVVAIGWLMIGSAATLGLLVVKFAG